MRRAYASAGTVEALDGSLESVTPAVEELFPADPLAPEDYLKAMSCLGYYGPLGPWGPLGVLGPIGGNSWNVDAYADGGSIAWRGWADDTLGEDDVGGPLGPEGPLSSKGPLGRAYWEDLPSVNDFGEQLQGGGVWTALGPLGPLGPLGALGPLGPLGPHGLEVGDDGAYLDGGQVVRTIEAAWTGSSKRTWELFESYPAERAQQMDDNDTSFMVRADAPSDTDEYPLRSASTQLVTVMVVPESASMFYPQAMGVLYAASLIGYDTPLVAPTPRSTTDDFDLEVTDADGKVLATSQAGALVDWVQLGVTSGTELRVRVRQRSTWDFWGASPTSGDYRLFVVGSSKYLTKTSIRGDHQRALGDVD